MKNMKLVTFATEKIVTENSTFVTDRLFDAIQLFFLLGTLNFFWKFTLKLHCTQDSPGLPKFYG